MLDSMVDAVGIEPTTCRLREHLTTYFQRLTRNGWQPKVLIGTVRNPYCGVNVGLKSGHTLFNQIGKTPNGPCVIESSSEPRYLSRPYHDLFVMEVPRWSFC